jgi:CO/xanthine dehydrogenase Mo-binding subunit
MTERDDLNRLGKAERAAIFGAGEAAQGPTGAAIANALAHAIGVRVRDLPLSKDQIAKALL